VIFVVLFTEVFGFVAFSNALAVPLEALPGWIRTFAALNPVTYGVDAARSIMLNRDAMTVFELPGFEGALAGLVPGGAVLVGLDLVFGAVAVYLLSQASSADVR
jgi:ABC-2 type transport system permease protein